MDDWTAVTLILITLFVSGAAMFIFGDAGEQSNLDSCLINCRNSFPSSEGERMKCTELCFSNLENLNQTTNSIPNKAISYYCYKEEGIYFDEGEFDALWENGLDTCNPPEGIVCEGQ